MSATLQGQGRSRSARHTRLRSGGGSTSSQPFHLNFSNPPTPSALLDAFGKTATSHIRALLHGSEGDDVITKLVGRLGIEYEPVSELNSASSSYAAIFWEKRSNWVVLAFKGTSPSEFDEWLTDFDITRVHAGHRLPGYKEVHRGFKARLFPEDKSGAKRRGNPYETIMKALKVVTRDLMRWTDKDINVWFTGHSLGCAMATLTYTRALLGLDGLDPRVQLCDAYLFGAPVVCDMASAKVFNDFMTHRQSKTGRVRNVWRVTNRCDAVSTLLPMLGDDPLYPHPTSLFAYAHLGSEVKMRPGSGTSIIVDNYCTPGSVPARVRRVKPYDGVPWWIAMLEYVPGMGRMVSHFPGLYFRSLQQMEPGDFVWRRS
ncbi:hypothetical protein M408DRAFT_82147 [Serendipita vermifera MAFF 305830]|uniref:Fungal lipase-type domain-containing protein n=1 Tax=Serendipita vermifera MAFF 305830 TaxID=933852 RepID=A0A0C2WRY5_SERVB|nr:hypothetical protein M408DRAFT_82147 [Serendipita vermifera MAFF 305830]